MGPWPCPRLWCLKQPPQPPQPQPPQPQPPQPQPQPQQPQQPHPKMVAFTMPPKQDKKWFGGGAARQHGWPSCHTFEWCCHPCLWSTADPPAPVRPHGPRDVRHEVVVHQWRARFLHRSRAVGNTWKRRDLSRRSWWIYIYIYIAIDMLLLYVCCIWNSMVSKRSWAQMGLCMFLCIYIYIYIYIHKGMYMCRCTYR